MYEAFYGLKSRPFSSTPDPRSFVDVGKTREVVDSLANSLRDGQGFVILTAASGLGKTITGREVLQQLSSELHPVFLANSHFPTKRSLLQSILYELGQAYSGMTEQELRLELQSAARQLHRSGSGIILMLDEAHRLNPRLLEELRTIADWDEDGHALIRILLTGQLELEEQLGEPELEALRQRIRCQQILEPLTLAESHDYLSQRVERCGATLAETFSDEAVRIICQASDGSPRCINQLADHSLLLGYMAEQRPVAADTVRSALEDLKQLPLHWNDVANLAPAQPASADADPDAEESGEDLESEPSQFTPHPSTEGRLSEVSASSEAEQETVPTPDALPLGEQTGIEDDEPSSETVVFEFGADLDPEADPGPMLLQDETTPLEPPADESAQATTPAAEQPLDDPFEVPFDNQVRLGGAQIEFWDEYPELYGQRIVPLPPDSPVSAHEPVAEQRPVNEQRPAESVSTDTVQTAELRSVTDRQHDEGSELGLEEVIVDPYARIDDGRPLSPEELRRFQETRPATFRHGETTPQSHETVALDSTEVTHPETASSECDRSVPEPVQASADEEFGRGWSEPSSNPTQTELTEADNAAACSDDAAQSAERDTQRSSTEYHYDHALELINEMLPMVDEALNPTDQDKQVESAAQSEPETAPGTDSSAQPVTSSNAWAEAPIEDEETVEEHLQHDLMNACRELSDALKSLDLDEDDSADLFPSSTASGQSDPTAGHTLYRQTDQASSDQYDQVHSPDSHRSAHDSSTEGMQSLFTRLRKRLHQ